MKITFESGLFSTSLQIKNDSIEFNWFKWEFFKQRYHFFNPIIAYPKHSEFKDIKDLEVNIYANGYRDRFVYYLTKIDSVCQKLIIECPISENYIYTIDVPIYLPSDDEFEIGKNVNLFSIFNTFEMLMNILLQNFRENKE